MVTKQKQVSDKLKINYATKKQIDEAGELSNTELYLVDLELPKNKVVITDKKGNFTTSPIKTSELYKLDGVRENVQLQIDTEVNRAQQAESELDTKIDTEIERTKEELQEEIQEETERATEVEGNLLNLSTDTKENLVAAINEVDNNTDVNAQAIATINSKIPEQASPENQLSDKAFVNSSVATNTANFIGTFNSIAERDAYSGPITNNDYCFVISTDAAGNTIYDRYKWTEATDPASWLFEYSLNNSSFTAVQWAAINSGATQTNIAQITTNQNAIGILGDLTTDAKNNLVSAVNEVDRTKQDNLSEGIGIDITNNVVSLDAVLNNLNDVTITQAENENFLLFDAALAKWINYKLTEIDGGHAGKDPPVPMNPDGGDSSTEPTSIVDNGFSDADVFYALVDGGDSIAI